MIHSGALLLRRSARVTFVDECVIVDRCIGQYLVHAEQVRIGDAGYCCADKWRQPERPELCRRAVTVEEGDTSGAHRVH